MLLFRQPEGKVPAEGARRVRDNVDAFGLNVRDDILSNGVSGREPDCVDKTVLLVGHPNLAAVGPEAWRHYSGSFNLTGTGRKYARDFGGISIPVNPKDAALPACYDHVKAICAKMVEGNPVVVRCEATRERRKQRYDTVMDLEDQSAFGGENVARGERG